MWGKWRRRGIKIRVVKGGREEERSGESSGEEKRWEVWWNREREVMSRAVGMERR